MSELNRRPSEQNYHHLCGHRRDSHANDVGLPSGYTRRNCRASDCCRASGLLPILHLHARDPRTGHPPPDPAVFMQFLSRIKQNCDAVVNITTGGGLMMTVEERLAAPLRASPEMCSLNMGSMNFRACILWHRVTRTGSIAWKNLISKAPRMRFSAILLATSRKFTDCSARATELPKFEHECYDVGHLYNLRLLPRRRPFQAARLSAVDLRHISAESAPILKISCS